MPDSAEYVEKIREYRDHAGLLTLWNQILARNTPGWDRGMAFEYLILRAFEIERAEVQWPYRVRLADGEDELEQIDGAIYFDNFAFLCEAKDQAKGIDVQPIAKLRNQLLRRPAAVVGAIFSSSDFTKPAITLAQFVSPQTILLWRGSEVEHALRSGTMRQAMVSKYRHSVEYGLPDFDTTLPEDA